MKRRRYRLANIVAIGVALTAAVASVWYRERFGPHPVASLGGLIALIAFLVFQALYDAQSEVANTATNLRIDALRDRIDLEARSLHHRVDGLQGRVEDFEAGRTPPHGTPIIKP